MREKYIIFALAMYFILTIACAYASQFSDRAIVENLLLEADGQRWYQIAKELVENEGYNSRYALRVHDVNVLDGRPKPDGACDNAADYIAEKFSSFGLEVEFDSFEHVRWTLEGKKQGEYPMRNVVATLPGKGPNKNRMYLMTAHYDSIASKTEDWEQNWRTLKAPGAVDNASGVAEVLETARILSQWDFDFTIKFIAFAGEELGLHGSKHYAKQAKERGEEIAGVLNFDTLGHDEDDILDVWVVADARSEWLANAIQTTYQLYNIDIDFHKVINPEFVYSDQSSFWEQGYSAVEISESPDFDASDWPSFIHSENDTLDKLNPKLGERAVQLAVATLAQLVDLLPEPTDLNPDLVLDVDSLVLLNPTPIRGDTVRLFAVVRNFGPGAVANAEVQFIVIMPDGEMRIIGAEKLNLETGVPQTVSGEFRVDDWGEYTIRVVVNPNVTIFEQNYDNNVLEKVMKVSSSTLRLSGISVYPNPLKFNEESQTLRVVYQLSKDAQVNFEIYVLSGKLVYSEQHTMGEDGGKLGVNNLNWRVRNASGNMVASGVYIVNITVTDDEGNVERKAKKVAVVK